MPPKPKPPSPPITPQQIAGVLSSITTGVETLLSTDPKQVEKVQAILLEFTTHPNIMKALGNPTPQEPNPATHPTILKDLQSIRTSLTVLQKAITAGHQTSKPNSSPKTPDSSPQTPKDRAKEKTITPTFATVAASPPRPSVMVNLAHITWDQRPTPPELCVDINTALLASDNDQTHISAARWTARENLILTGGPNTTVQQLQSSIPLIRQHFATAYLSSDEPDSPPLPTIRPNVKWSKILLNSVPTRVSPKCNAKSPEECHIALLTENPLYAKLTVTQKPSWVRNPSTYTEGAVSSLIVAFKDLDGSLLHSLLTNKVLYIFGSCTTLRKWKQQPTTHINSPTHATSPSTPTPEHLAI